MFDNLSGQPYSDAASDVEGSMGESIVVTEVNCSISMMCKPVAPISWSAVTKEHRESRWA